MAPLQRNTTIDFWRGLVLVFIFVNHIPGNLIEEFTPRNFGFSDAAEAFIFLAGLSIVLVYYPKLPEGNAWLVVRRCIRRAFELYRIHLLLTAAAIALFSVGYELSEDMGLIQENGRSAVFGDTAKGVTGILTLGHQLGYFNILPLYITLMIWADKGYDCLAASFAEELKAAIGSPLAHAASPPTAVASASGY